MKAQALEKSKRAYFQLFSRTVNNFCGVFRCYENINYLINKYAPFPEGESGLSTQWPDPSKLPRNLGQLDTAWWGTLLGVYGIRRLR